MRGARQGGEGRESASARRAAFADRPKKPRDEAASQQAARGTFWGERSGAASVCVCLGCILLGLGSAPALVDGLGRVGGGVAPGWCEGEGPKRLGRS